MDDTPGEERLGWSSDLPRPNSGAVVIPASGPAFKEKCTPEPYEVWDGPGPPDSAKPIRIVCPKATVPPVPSDDELNALLVDESQAPGETSAAEQRACRAHHRLSEELLQGRLRVWGRALFVPIDQHTREFLLNDHDDPYGEAVELNALCLVPVDHLDDCRIDYKRQALWHGRHTFFVPLNGRRTLGRVDGISDLHF